jgi:hypothetical protein
MWSRTAASGSRFSCGRAPPRVGSGRGVYGKGAGQFGAVDQPGPVILASAAESAALDGAQDAAAGHAGLSAACARVIMVVERSVASDVRRSLRRNGYRDPNGRRTLRSRANKDEPRKDREEGLAFHLLNDLKNDRSVGFATMTGGNAYILSATSRTGPEIVEAFGPDRLEIVEPIGFCAEIANEIPGCQGAMISQCLYADNKALVTVGTAPTIDDLKSETEPDKVSLEKMMAQGKALRGPKQYFLKGRKHEAQSEYRFVWETNRPVKEPLIITAPNLRKYCNL